MSTQAEVAFKILIRLYIEFDQRTGWATEGQIVKVMSLKEGVSEGRASDGVKLLRRLKMLEFRDKEGCEELKISPYGVEWLDKNCPLLSRDKHYEFSLPIFRTLNLVGPDEFYGAKQNSTSVPKNSIDWTKWGAIAALFGIPIPVVIWWLT